MHPVLYCFNWLDERSSVELVSCLSLSLSSSAWGGGVFLLMAHEVAVGEGMWNEQRSRHFPFSPPPCSCYFFVVYTLCNENEGISLVAFADKINDVIDFPFQWCPSTKLQQYLKNRRGRQQFHHLYFLQYLASSSHPSTRTSSFFSSALSNTYPLLLSLLLLQPHSLSTFQRPLTTVICSSNTALPVTLKSIRSFSGRALSLTTVRYQEP